MKMNKTRFLKTELGGDLVECIESWDKALDSSRIYQYGSEEYDRARKAAYWCQAQWEAYQKAIKQFYGIEYHFTRTEDYYGLVTDGETDWLLKVEKQKEKGAEADGKKIQKAAL